MSRVRAAVFGKRGAAPLIKPYKAKEGNRALRGSRTYIHGGARRRLTHHGRSRLRESSRA